MAVLSAGYLAQPQLSLSAMAIYQNSNALAFMLPAGMAVACSTRCSHVLGVLPLIPSICGSKDIVQLYPPAS